MAWMVFCRDVADPGLVSIPNPQGHEARRAAGARPCRQSMPTEIAQ